MFYEKRFIYTRSHRGRILFRKKKPLPSRIFDIDYGILDRYQGQANVTLNKEMNKKELLLNCCLGLAGECGEVVDLVKNGTDKDIL